MFGDDGRTDSKSNGTDGSQHHQSERSTDESTSEGRLFAFLFESCQEFRASRGLQVGLTRGVLSCFLLLLLLLPLLLLSPLLQDRLVSLLVCFRDETARRRRIETIVAAAASAAAITERGVGASIAVAVAPCASGWW